MTDDKEPPPLGKRLRLMGRMPLATKAEIEARQAAAKKAAENAEPWTDEDEEDANEDY